MARKSGGAGHVDIAIVGGGVSGLYSAWRLKEAHPKKTIVVYESDYRSGGRLLTAVPPKAEKLRAELGGMRFLSTHRIVAGLATLLKLDVQPFPVSEPTTGVPARLAFPAGEPRSGHPAAVPPRGDRTRAVDRRADGRRVGRDRPRHHDDARGQTAREDVREHVPGPAAVRMGFLERAVPRDERGGVPVRRRRERLRHDGEQLERRGRDPVVPRGLRRRR